MYSISVYLKRPQIDWKLPLADVPNILKIRIIKKLNPRTFVKFHRTCKIMQAVCHSSPNLVVFPVKMFNLKDDMPNGTNFLVVPAMRTKCNVACNYLSIKNEMSPFRLLVDNLAVLQLKTPIAIIEELAQMILERKLLCKHFHFAGELEGREELIKSCIRASKQLNAITITAPTIFRQFFPASIFDNINFLDLLYTDYEDDDLIQLRIRNITIKNSNITSHGINLFIRQWCSHEREILFARFSNIKNLSEEEVVEKLPVTLLYSHGSYNDDLFPLPFDFNVDYAFYALTRTGKDEDGDDVDENLLMTVREDYVIIEPHEDPSEHVWEWGIQLKPFFE